MRHLPLLVAVVVIEFILVFLFLNIVNNYPIIEDQIDWGFIAAIASLSLTQVSIFSSLLAYGRENDILTIVVENEDEE